MSALDDTAVAYRQAVADLDDFLAANPGRHPDGSNAWDAEQSDRHRALTLAIANARNALHFAALNA